MSRRDKTKKTDVGISLKKAIESGKLEKIKACYEGKYNFQFRFDNDNLLELERSSYSSSLSISILCELSNKIAYKLGTEGYPAPKWFEKTTGYYKSIISFLLKKGLLLNTKSYLSLRHMVESDLSLWPLFQQSHKDYMNSLEKAFRNFNRKTAIPTLGSSDVACFDSKLMQSPFIKNKEGKNRFLVALDKQLTIKTDCSTVEFIRKDFDDTYQLRERLRKKEIFHSILKIADKFIDGGKKSVLEFIVAKMLKNPKQGASTAAKFLILISDSISFEEHQYVFKKIQQASPQTDPYTEIFKKSICTFDYKSIKFMIERNCWIPFMPIKYDNESEMTALEFIIEKLSSKFKIFDLIANCHPGLTYRKVSDITLTPKMYKKILEVSKNEKEPIAKNFLKGRQLAWRDKCYKVLTSGSKKEIQSFLQADPSLIKLFENEINLEECSILYKITEPVSN